MLFLLLVELLPNRHHFSLGEVVRLSFPAHPDAFPQYIRVYVPVLGARLGAECARGRLVNSLCQALDFGLVWCEFFLAEPMLVGMEEVLKIRDTR